MKRLILLVLILAACAAKEGGDPTQTVKQYLEARVASNAEDLQKLSCAAWESQAALQADSFRSMDAKIEGLACTREGESGNYTLVACEGKIITTYNGETREWELGTYQLLQEDGEWKFCGEASSPN